MNPINEELQALVGALEKELGVPERFLLGLVAEHDWSFIIKAHALVEAAVMQAIETRMNNAPVADVVSGLLLNNTRSGKLAFLRALGHDDKAFVRFVDGLSRMRNLLVHGLGHADFDINKHVSGMSEAHFREFVDAFGTTAEFPRAARATIRARQEQLVRQVPRDAVLHLTFFYLAQLQLGTQHETYKRIEMYLERIERGRT